VTTEHLENTKQWKKISEIEGKIDDVHLLKETVETTLARVQEMDNIWMFFQRFVDEQGNDQVKIVRGSSYSIVEKINAMEWVARYIEFVSPDTVTMIVNYFKDIYTGPDSHRHKTYVEYEHTSEAIPTIFQKVKSKIEDFEQQEINFWPFDEGLCMLLMILEPLLVNDDNLDMFLKINAVDPVCRLILLQRMTSNLDVWQNDVLIKEGKHALVSHNHLVTKEKFTDEHGTIIPMKSFRFLLRIIVLMCRNKTVLKVLVRDLIYF
jgi:hypothetical protein